MTRLIASGDFGSRNSGETRPRKCCSSPRFKCNDYCIIPTQIHALEKQQKAVILEQLYSERIPCKDCQDKLHHEFSEAAVFYTVPELRGQSRGEALMRAYGLEPPKP